MYIKEDGESNFYPVTSMLSTFFGLNGLQEAPEIPSSVVEMNLTFHGCTNLTQAPEIPSGVRVLYMTFYGCTNLTGILKINAEPTNYSSCLRDAATAEGCALELTGPNTTVLNKILGTATGNVTIKQ